MTNDKCNTINHGVTCSVCSCVHHCGEQSCNAAVINVRDEKVPGKSETCCSTYKAK